MLGWVFMLLILGQLSTAAVAVPNSECLDCHEAELRALKKGQPPTWVGVKSDACAHSAHGKLNCIECHATITQTPHDSKLPAVDCTGCHDKLRVTHVFHSRLALKPLPVGLDTACSECHDSHETVAVK
jgi:hypothetical protein